MCEVTAAAKGMPSGDFRSEACYSRPYETENRPSDQYTRSNIALMSELWLRHKGNWSLYTDSVTKNAPTV